MSRELEFTGYWEGYATYQCDQCHRVSQEFSFDDDEIDSKRHRKKLREQGWITTKVGGEYKDFCTESCRNQYIKNHT